MIVQNAYDGQEPYIFISYAHKDSDKVFPIIRALNDRGFRVWYDVGIEAGTEWPEYIASRLNSCTCFLAFISQNALDSHNCRREINFAIELRKDPLAVYLEDVKLSLGMRMQLGSLQALFFNRHSSQDTFMNALCDCELLKPCKAQTAHTAPAADGGERDYLAGRQHEEAQHYSDALACYQLAADLGHAEAQARLGKLYLDGNGTEKDYSEAVKWITKSAAQGNALGQHQLAWCYYYGYGLSKNISEAARLWKLSAAQGMPRAQNCLGILYKNGKGVAQDFAEASRLFRLSAEQGDATAQDNLARAYLYGRGVTKDYAEAAKWFQKSAEQGRAGAQYYLAYCYQNELGVKKDLAVAEKWYRAAAEQNNTDAQYELGNMYALGERFAANGDAAKWLRLAAEKGHSKAQYSLGLLYTYGVGVTEDDEAAFQWYRKAAEQNNVYAQHQMGVCFENGRGVKKDLSVALQWYKLSDSLDDSKEAIRRVESALASPTPKNYIVVDNVTGKPVDQSKYTFQVDSAYLPKTCRWCGSQYSPRSGNICKVCGGNND